MSFSLQNTYYQLMVEGKKIIEGRINKDKFKLIKTGDLLTVFNSTDEKQNFKIQILDRREYKDFKSMLEAETLESILPGVKSVEEGVKIYYSIPGYKENESKGVVAFVVQKL